MFTIHKTLKNVKTSQNDYSTSWRLAPRMVPPKLVHSFVQMALYCHQGNDTPSPIEEDVRPGKPRQNQGINTPQ